MTAASGTGERYRVMTDPARLDDVVRMMAGLYREDPAAQPVDPAGFPRTVRALLAEPARGLVVLMGSGGSVVGYALLIPYWSNEVGGVICFVDELFVEPGQRGRGWASGLFAWLAEERPFGAVALGLEVTPGNQRARALYAGLGFTPKVNTEMLRFLTGKPR